MMLRRRVSSAPCPPLSGHLTLVEHASYTDDTQGLGGVLLDERSGRYWRLLSPHHRIAMAIATDGGMSCFNEVGRRVFPPISDNALSLVLASLWKTGLFQETDLKLAAPPHRMLAEYVLLNIGYQIILRCLGWRAVARIRLTQKPRTPPEPVGLEGAAVPPRIVEVLLGIVVLASGLPGVTADCVPISLTLRTMLRRRGYTCHLVIGTRTLPFRPHMWVEVDGHMIDPSTSSASRERFKPRSALVDTQRWPQMARREQ